MSAEAASHLEGGVGTAAALGQAVSASVGTDGNRLQVGQVGGGHSTSDQRTVVIGRCLDTSGLNGIGNSLHVGSAGLGLAIGHGAQVQRQSHSHQDRQDQYHHQQFDQSEASAGAARFQVTM